MTAPAIAGLAAVLQVEAERHPPRSPGRRAAAHAWAALITSPAVDAARRAITTFGTEQTRADALELLDQLIDQADNTTTEETTAI
ncbi:hypothetical protein [Trebonia sp.]|uniref:hypothetical protein n=1 Tax=Trebonia sp. TaxID=2767075 RepID=UPI0026141ECC|nr:hypothetical protein [Trebonia sp.]